METPVATFNRLNEKIMALERRILRLEGLNGIDPPERKVVLPGREGQKIIKKSGKTPATPKPSPYTSSSTKTTKKTTNTKKKSPPPPPVETEEEEEEDVKIDVESILNSVNNRDEDEDEEEEEDDE
jgi:hypothetical protein